MKAWPSISLPLLAPLRLSAADAGVRHGVESRFQLVNLERVS